MRLAFEEGLGELLGLVVGDLAGQWGLVRVDVDVDDGRAVEGECVLDRRFDLLGVVDLRAVAAAGGGPGCEVRDRLREPDPVFGVAEDHLLPQDLPERAVVVDDHLDRQLVADRGEELGHQHREAAVADVGDHLPSGEGVLDADRVRQPGGHRREVPRQVELPVPADRPVPGRPGRDRAAVTGQDRVVGGEVVEHADRVLRGDRAALG